MAKKDLSLILHNIRSSHNVGAIFRTADGAGVSKIYLTGYTPKPIDQFGRPDKALAKTALGAEKTIAWQYLASASTLINKLKKSGTEIIALEQAPDSVDFRRAKIKWPAALLLGEEVEGVNKALLKKSDQIIEIPMRGQKESLNVSVATGIAVYEILK
ncbi:MAG: TrmH family RNA methyltransferase [Candidatus Paceibacterota bacterium]|jgi:tRNA G18 (ribose-2'-O)-methylase SpoU